MALTIVSTFFSCTKDSTPPAPPAPPPAAPVANFTYTGAGVAPSTVTFTNTSTNATSYLWDFGNNATSVEASPTIKYTAGGVYTVKLTATGAGGSNSTTKTVNITAPTTLKIMSVRITAMPLTKANGGTWDDFPSSGPDVYIKITDNANTTFYKWPFIYRDIIASNLPLNFIIENSSSVATPLIITSANFSKNIALELWDDDGILIHDFLAGIVFAPSSLTTGANAYPTTATATVSGLTAVFTLKWE